jgi:hypothetical protein
MRIENLKNPGTYSGGQSLRARVAHAISFAEVVNKGRTGEDVSPTAKSIADFLADAATKCPGYEAPAPDPLPDNQVILEDGDTVAVGDVDGTAEVADGELVGVNLPANAAVVVSGTEVAVGGVPATLTVTGGALSPNAAIDATNAVVKNSDAITIKNSAGATISAAGVATVAANAVSGVALPATIAGVANSASVTLLPASGTTPAQGTGTAAVAAGVVTGVRLPATSAVVTDGQTITVTGGTVTLTVAANSVTAEFTPDEE